MSEYAAVAPHAHPLVGQLSALLQGREGVRVVGDRFVFQSEVLFPSGSAQLQPAGERQLARHDNAYVTGTGGVMSEQAALVLQGA